MKKLLAAIEEQERVFASEADWELKFEVIFKRNKEVVQPLLATHVRNFQWYDPDSTYEEDVTAYMTALTELKERLQKLPVMEEVEPEAVQQVAFVVVLRRSAGDTPKIEKISDGKIHLTQEDANRAREELPEGMERNAYEVREIVVEFPAAGADGSEGDADGP